MKERPIIMSAPMVRAILAGKKTATRRVVELREFQRTDTPGYDWCFRDRRLRWNDVVTNRLLEKWCPHGVVGDRLWIKETFSGHDGYVYRADGDVQLPPGVRWCSPLHMPRRAARLILDIESVFVERLHEITDEGAEAEGVSDVERYSELWDSINGEKHPWRSNPWCWVLEFRRVEA